MSNEKTSILHEAVVPEESQSEVLPTTTTASGQTTDQQTASQQTADKQTTDSTADKQTADPVKLIKEALNTVELTEEVNKFINRHKNLIQLPAKMGKVKVEFRSMKLTDLKAVKSLNEDNLPENYHESVWQEKYANGKDTSFVAIFAGQVVGYIVSYPLESGLYIMSLAVDKNFRRHGVGKELIHRLVNLNKNITLHVRKSNKTAKKFYKHRSFTKMEEVEGYYTSPPENGIRMVRLANGTKQPISKYITCVV